MTHGYSHGGSARLHLAQGHTASKRQSRNRNSDVSDSKICILCTFMSPEAPFQNLHPLHI